MAVEVTGIAPAQLSQEGWLQVIQTVAVSRALDDLEERVLLPARKVLYQFLARAMT